MAASVIHPLNPLQQHLSCSGVTSFCILFIGDIFKSNFKRQRDCTREFQAEVEQQTLNQSVEKKQNKGSILHSLLKPYKKTTIHGSNFNVIT